MRSLNFLLVLAVLLSAEAAPTTRLRRRLLGDADTSLNVKPADGIQAMMDAVEEGLKKVSSLVTNEATAMVKKKEQDALDQHRRDRKAAREAAKHAQAKATEARYKEALRRFGEFRTKVSGCLNMIRGGADKTYMDLRKRLSQIPADRACDALKEYDWPKYEWHGHNQPGYKPRGAPDPDRSGQQTLFFSAAKTRIIECACDRAERPPPILSAQTTRVSQMQQRFEQRLLSAYGPDRLQPNPFQPTLMPANGLRPPRPLPPAQSEKRDCWGEWSAWTECEPEHGNVNRRTYRVLKSALWGGKPCPFGDGETQTATGGVCAQNCVGEWTKWSECEGGSRTRKFIVQRHKKGDGEDCEVTEDAVSEAMREWKTHPHLSHFLDVRKVEVSASDCSVPTDQVVRIRTRREAEDAAIEAAGAPSGNHAEALAEHEAMRAKIRAQAAKNPVEQEDEKLPTPLPPEERDPLISVEPDRAHALEKEEGRKKKEGEWERNGDPKQENSVRGRKRAEMAEGELGRLQGRSMQFGEDAGKPPPPPTTTEASSELEALFNAVSPFGAEARQDRKERAAERARAAADASNAEQHARLLGAPAPDEEPVGEEKAQPVKHVAVTSVDPAGEKQKS
jgi:hypothetical protein